MKSLHLIEHQPRWRVALVARFAQFIGVLIHVEGFPFGSSRNNAQRGEVSGAQGSAKPLHQGSAAEVSGQSTAR